MTEGPYETRPFPVYFSLFDRDILVIPVESCSYDQSERERRGSDQCSEGEGPLGNTLFEDWT